MRIHLTYINASYDINRPSVIVIQKNEALPATASAVAWKVIKNCGYLCYHPFTFSLQTQMAFIQNTCSCAKEHERAKTGHRLQGA